MWRERSSVNFAVDSMIAKLLMSRLVDLLLIGAAVYFLFPGVRRYFRLSKKESQSSQRRYNVFTNRKQRAEEHNVKGQYIDYEEVK